MPIDRATPKINMLRCDQPTPDRIESAADATMPNMTITPPPNISIGMVVMKAPIFGARPHRMRNRAPIVTTWRLMRPVIAINPTFWLKDVLGIAPKMPDSAVPRPSALVAPISSRSVAGRPAPPSQIADTAPIDSIAEMKPIRQKPNIAGNDTAKPKWKGCGTMNHPAASTGASDTRPIAAATA